MTTTVARARESMTLEERFQLPNAGRGAYACPRGALCVLRSCCGIRLRWHAFFERSGVGRRPVRVLLFYPIQVGAKVPHSQEQQQLEQKGTGPRGIAVLARRWRGYGSHRLLELNVFW